MPLFENFPRTKMKIFLASVLYRIVRIFLRTPTIQARRNGIWYALDLSEGIDLAIFLFGGFQRHVYGNLRVANIDGGVATIIDVGANMGCMSLQFARQFPGAHVHAFEPTRYGYAKFQRNLELNADLADRITLVQQFVSDITTEAPSIKAYASWKVDGSSDGSRHPVHLGSVQSADGVSAITLDVYCAEKCLRDVRLIKVDTDGHELHVLHGAREIIESQRPLVIFELGRYVMAEQGTDFAEYLEFFDLRAYELYNSADGALLNGRNWQAQVPKYGTIDVLAVPRQVAHY